MRHVLPIFALLAFCFAGTSDAQLFYRHRDECDCEECQPSHLDRYRERTEQIAERHNDRDDRSLARYEAHLERADARQWWDVIGRWQDHVEAASELQRLRDRANDEDRDRREMARQHHLWEMARERQLDFGRAQLHTKFGADIDQQMDWEELVIDEAELLKRLEKRKREQQRIQREREERESLAESDEERRSQLRRHNRHCNACQKVTCECPKVASEPLREPLRDAPLEIPMLVRANLKLQLASSGYEDVEMRRLPPVRESLREPLRKDEPAQKDPSQNSGSPSSRRDPGADESDNDDAGGERSEGLRDTTPTPSPVVSAAHFGPVSGTRGWTLQSVPVTSWPW